MKLSICCLTYNHGDYLEEAINSFVSQQTSFKFEIVIGDDASTDGTQEVVRKYQEKFPNIKYYRHDNNIGMMPNAVFTLNSCKGEFIALCEGDDYWIDEYKLQKQVDFLEANKEYAICVTAAIDRNEYSKKEEIHIPGASISLEDLLKHNLFRTVTAVFDAQYLRPTPEWFKELPFGDWATYLTVLYKSKKKAGCLPQITGVRRLHGAGTYSSMYSSNEKVIQTLKWDIDFYKKMQTHLFKRAYQSLIATYIAEKEAMVAYLKDEQGTETALLNEIESFVPANGSFILVDEWCLNITGEVEGKKVVPFMEKDGVYWGRPSDDFAAINEIERQRKKGVNLIIFTWQAFWWLEHYAGMYEYLKTNYRCILNTQGLIGFNIQQKLANQKVKFQAASL